MAVMQNYYSYKFVKNKTDKIFKLYESRLRENKNIIDILIKK